MNPTRSTFVSLVSLAAFAAAGALTAQQKPAPAAPATAQGGKPTFEEASSSVQKDLAKALDDLAKLRDKVAAEKVPLSQDLRELEDLRLNVNSDEQRVTRLLDSRTLDLATLSSDIEKRRANASFLGNLMADHARNFEARLHIAELDRYEGAIAGSRLARENTKLDEDALFAAELAVVDASIDRIQDALAGSRFDGKAVDSTGLVRPGTFVLVGPLAVFRSADGQEIGSVEQRLGSLEPTVVPFPTPEDREATAQLVVGTGGALPLDPTLGNAHKIAGIEETWLEHVQKGGPIMWPMFALAAAALLVVLVKWLSMGFIRRPSPKLVGHLLDSVAAGDREAAVERADAIGGPAGAMLQAGAAHVGEPRELVEEVMFERVLSTRLRLQSWLPFVAICATSAPLLGLLGTVTGIMNTFTLMTVFGTGDPKTLSSGISEALITTEYGLIVAIPSLLLHAFLSRRARAIVDDMEKVAVSFLNHIRTPAAAA